ELAEVIAVPDRAFDGAALLISVPHGGSLAAIMDALVKAGASVRSSALVGSHATRYTVSAEGQRPLPTGRERGFEPNVRVAAPTAASRRARHRRLCARQERGAGGGARVQAVVQRVAARA